MFDKDKHHLEERIEKLEHEFKFLKKEIGDIHEELAEILEQLKKKKREGKGTLTVLP